MAKIKSYTNLEQSKKLAKILPVESADMWYAYYYNAVNGESYYDKEPLFHKPVCYPEHAIPCWSIGALLSFKVQRRSSNDFAIKRELGSYPEWTVGLPYTHMKEGEDLMETIVKTIIYCVKHKYIKYTEE